MVEDAEVVIAIFGSGRIIWGMKTIFAAVFLSVAGIVLSASAGDRPRGADHVPLLQPGALVDEIHSIQISLSDAVDYVEDQTTFAADKRYSALPGVALDRRPPVSALQPISIESTMPFRLQLTLSAPSFSFISLTESAPVRIAAAPAHSAALSPTAMHVGPVSPPVIISIEVNYPNADDSEKKAVLEKMRAKVGLLYSYNSVEEDMRSLTATIKDVKRVRIFGVPVAGGVKLIVAAQPNSGFDFNIGYQF